MKKTSALEQLLKIMARLRSPTGCPWDRVQDHHTLRHHAVEEVYELIDAIEAKDDEAMLEELGDLLLQIVFHCQLARERRAFDFDAVCRHLVEKLIRRHPHVFGTAQARTADVVWAQWDRIKHDEKKGTRHERTSSLDGIPRHLPTLLRAEKLLKKARKAGLLHHTSSPSPALRKTALARQLLELTRHAQGRGWSAEELLRAELGRLEKELRRRESKQARGRPREG